MPLSPRSGSEQSRDLPSLCLRSAQQAREGTLEPDRRGTRPKRSKDVQPIISRLSIISISFFYGFLLTFLGTPSRTRRSMTSVCGRVWRRPRRGRRNAPPRPWSGRRSWPQLLPRALFPSTTTDSLTDLIPLRGNDIFLYFVYAAVLILRLPTY